MHQTGFKKKLYGQDIMQESTQFSVFTLGLWGNTVGQSVSQSVSLAVQAICP